MNTKGKMILYMVGLTLAAMLLAACGSDQGASKPDVEAVAVEEIVISYDGQTCSHNAPPVIVAGDITVIIDNQTEGKVMGDVAVLLEGKSYEDLWEDLGEPGNASRMPDWAPVANSRPVISNPKAKIYTFEPGHYAITCIETFDTGTLANYPGGEIWVE